LHNATQWEFFGYFKQRLSNQKLFPTQVKTLGDSLLLNRVKADLTQVEWAGKFEIRVRSDGGQKNNCGHENFLREFFIHGED
jgi:hypothetical protein